MARTGSGFLAGSDRRLWVVLVALTIVVVVALKVSQAPSQDGSIRPFPSEPALACQLPVIDEKDGRTLDWHLAAKTDRATGSVILFVSEAEILVCHVARSDDGSLGAIATFMSRVTNADTTRLTLDTASEISGRMAEILSGRVPPTTATVWVDVGDGTNQPATVGGGYYLAWLTDPGVPVRIDALDADAHLVQRLQDPNGLDISG